jgi:D-alanyl-D-alanine carboxypeptidase (penicillin-binding protein 5/6)
VRKRRLRQFGLLALLGLIGVRPALGADLTIKAKAAILMEPHSGRILFAQDERRRFPPASVTKLMTMLLIMEAVDRGKLRWDDRIPTSATAAGMGGSQVFLREHEVLTLREMFKAIAVVSANDASTAVAEYLYGSDQDFIKVMNRRARRLGLRDTHFANETGLPDPDHYSSAFDLAMIARELLKYPEVLRFTAIWMDSLRSGKFILKNTNDLIKYYQGADGLKTGHTAEAKYCLAATAQKEGFRLLSVILGTESNAERIAQTRRLLDYGFRNYEWRMIKPARAQVGEITIRKASPMRVTVETHAKFHALRERDNQKPIRLRVEPFPNLKLPTGVNQKVGLLKAFQNETLIGSAPVYPTRPLKKANWLILMWRGFWGWIGGLFGKK